MNEWRKWNMIGLDIFDWAISIGTQSLPLWKITKHNFSSKKSTLGVFVFVFCFFLITKVKALILLKSCSDFRIYNFFHDLR